MDSRARRLGVAAPVVTLALLLALALWPDLVPTAAAVVFSAAAVGVALVIVLLSEDRRRALRSLRESEARLQGILDNTNAVVYVKALDGRYLTVNRRFETLFGISRATITGKTSFDVFDPAAETFGANDRQALAAGVPLELEETVPQDDGVHTYLSVKFPLRDAGGHAYAVCGVSTDITERRRIEAERTRLLEHARSARAEAEALAGVGRFLGQTLDIEVLGGRIVESVRVLLRLQAALLYRVDGESGELILVAASGTEAATGAHAVLPPGTGTVGLAVRERRPVLTTDVLADGRIALTATERARIELASYRAVLALPLMIHDAAIGALALGDVAGREFDDRDVRLAQTFADYAALALENAGLYSAAARRRREAELVAELARAMNAARDVDTVLLRVGDGARSLCGAAGCRVALRDGASRRLALHPRLGPSHDGDQLALDSGPVAEVLATGRPFRGDTGTMIVPITLSGAVEGLVCVERRDARPFGDREEAILVQLADHAANAITNLRVLGDEHSARAKAEAAEGRTAFLVETSEVLGSSLDYQTTLTSLARLIVPYLADWCAIDMVEDDDSFSRLAVVHRDPAKDAAAAELRRAYPPQADGGHGLPHVLRTGRPEFRPNVADGALDARDADHVRVLRELGLSSYICVPLVARARTLGAITLAYATPGRSYGADDLALAEAIGHRAGVAVDNARLFREAQAASRAKDEFLAAVSHELRTPLHAMLGWTRMLRTGTLDDSTATRALDTLERNTKLQAQLIEDLLDISRMVTGKLRMEIRPVDLAPIVEAAIDSVRPAAESKGVRVRLDVADDASPVAGDPDRLQQLVWNLLSNAIKFTPRGGEVDVRVDRRDGVSRVRVADTGQGIGPELLPHVFERFRQAESSAARLHGGLGLGLAIVRHIAERHGGVVRAESAGAGRGATFTVELPLLAGRGSPQRVAAEQRGAPLPAPEALRGFRVLVVEDQADARELLVTILGGCGADVTAVGSADEALDAVARTRPQALVSDIGLPGDDGYTLIRKVRALDPAAGGRVPAAALTAYARREDRRLALLAGYQLHLAKPIDPSEVIAVVATLANLAQE